MSFTRFNSSNSFKRFSQSPANPYDTTSLDNQIANAEMRVKDAGYSPANTDKRNWFEKAVNLPKGQNWFFDTLEILGRPGQALMNAIDKKNTNMGLGESLLRGISGEDRVRGSDLLDNTNLNSVGKAIVGTGLEIALDPLTYVPGGVLAKGVTVPAKAAGKAVGGVVKAAEETFPSFARFNNKVADVVRPAAESAKDGLGYMFNRDYKIDETLSGGKSDFLKDLSQATDNSRRSMQEDTLESLGRTARDAGGIQAGEDVGRILENPLRQFEDVKMYEFPDGARRTTSKRELGNEIIGNKQRIKELGGVVRENRRNIESSISQTATKLEKIDRQIRREYFSKENAALRKLNGKKNVPSNIDELAQKQAFDIVGASPKFNLLLKQREELKTQLDNLRNTKSNIGSAEISDITKLNADNEALRESTRNPVMVQREIPRPERELSTDPKIQKAAQNLVESNASIRQFAEQNGIDIPELEGYMTHVWSQEERARRSRISPVDRGSRGTGNPNKSILKARELTGSAEDINEQLGRKFFEPNAFYASAIGKKRLIDYVHAVKFRREVLSNKDFATPFKKGMEVPKGAEVIDTANYKFLKDSGDPLEGMKLADEVGGQYIVTKQAKMLLDRYQRLNTDEGTKAFLKAFDGIQSLWKRLSLFSLGYHARNQVGAMFNNYVGGMNPVDLANYTKQGFREVARSIGGKESSLFSEYRKQGLSSTALSQVEFAKYGEEPERAIEKTVRNLSKDTKGQVLQRVNPLNAFQTSQEIGNFFDQANRFALYKWAREKKGMTPEQAAAKVREVQFDYTKLTPFEQNVMARVVPFYRWMRNNIPFQVRQFINDPRKYQYLNKARLNAQENVGLNEDNIPDYMKQSFMIPLHGKDGKGEFLSLGLPLADLTKLSSPVKTLVDSTTPLIKTPAEIATNYNVFRGKPIQRFSGQQQQYQIPYTDIGFGLPIKTGYAIDQMTGQIGRGLSGFLQKEQDKDNVNRLPTLGISSIKKPFDAEQYAYYAKLDQLKQLQDLILYIEQQTGDKPRTVNEINRGR